MSTCKHEWFEMRCVHCGVSPTSTPAATAVESSDLVAAGDAMFKALKAIQADLGCGCGGEWGTCKQCTHDNIEAAAAIEAWEEAKKEAVVNTVVNATESETPFLDAIVAKLSKENHEANRST